MRILVITRAAWRDDNNTGNTLSNIFGDMSDFDFYNLYFRNQKPMNDIAVSSFFISEKQLFRNLLNKSDVGTVVIEKDLDIHSDDNLYNKAKKYGNNLLMFLREILWCVGRWKSANLKKYLEDIKPDVIFMPVFNCFYPHKILRFIKKQTGAKVILFHADDNYTLKQFSVSPIYWLYRFRLRKWVRSSVKLADINYAISYLQKDEYEKKLKKTFKVLTKSIYFPDKPTCKEEYNKPLQLIFTGNINMNRWISLEHIANVLERINANGVKAQLRVYTGNQLNDKINGALNKGDSSFIMGSVSADKIKQIQNNADMLVHVEALDLRNKLTVRQSFSTKIVDYLAAARPILAFGPKDVASVEHFVKNDCAVVADSEGELLAKLTDIIENKDKLNELAVKAFECGRNLHNKADIDNMLKNDIEQLMN